MKARGWICLFRSIRENAFWKIKPFSKGQAWIDLLLRANHKPRQWVTGTNVVHIAAGQFVTSQKRLANDWGWSRGRVQNFLKVLQKARMIEQQISTQFTLITILNYSRFQGAARKGKAPKQQRGSTDAAPPQQRGSIAAAQTTMNNNDNNENKYAPACDRSALADEHTPKPRSKNVFLSDRMWGDWCAEYGEEFMQRCVQKLQGWISSMPNDLSRIEKGRNAEGPFLSWVFSEVAKEKIEAHAVQARAESGPKSKAQRNVEILARSVSDA